MAASRRPSIGRMPATMSASSGVEISWEEFFRQFDESKLALLYEQNSRFGKLVGRDTAERREHGDHRTSRHAERQQQPHHAPRR